MSAARLPVERLCCEFSRVVHCTNCNLGTSRELLRDCGENVPQPGYVGLGYERAGLLLVGQNPGVPGGLALADRRYTAALRALADQPTPPRYVELQSVLDDFIPTWPIHGKYFPLEQCGLTLADVAYCNLVRCRTKENAPPKVAAAAICRSAHFEPWLDLLKPAVIVFIGKWGHDRGRDACVRRAIPFTYVDRNRKLRADERAANLDAVKAFVVARLRAASNVPVGNPRP